MPDFDNYSEAVIGVRLSGRERAYWLLRWTLPSEVAARLDRSRLPEIIGEGDEMVPLFRVWLDGTGFVYASTEMADVNGTDARQRMVERVSRQLDALTDGHRRGGDPTPVYAVIVYTGDAEESLTDSADQEPTPPHWHIREVHLEDLNGSYDRQSPEKPTAANPHSHWRR